MSKRKPFCKICKYNHKVRPETFCKMYLMTLENTLEICREHGMDV